jgi:hypothetical protein
VWVERAAPWVGVTRGRARRGLGRSHRGDASKVESTSNTRRRDTDGESDSSPASGRGQASGGNAEAERGEAEGNHREILCAAQRALLIPVGAVAAAGDAVRRTALI